MKMNADTVIVGSGVAGLFSALNLPEEQDIILITKSDLESSDSFLAQGGICVLRDEGDYDSYFEDTMKAGHYENRKESVDIMIRNSRDIINDLVKYGVEFEKKDGEFAYTREGAHSKPRILFHEDVTGKEITSKLLAQVKKMKNVKMYEYTEMTDVIIEDGIPHIFGFILVVQMMLELIRRAMTQSPMTTFLTRRRSSCAKSLDACRSRLTLVWPFISP